MPTVALVPASGRYLSFVEREEIAILRAAVPGCVRSRAGSDARRRRSRGSCAATPRPAAAGWSTAPRPRKRTSPRAVASRAQERRVGVAHVVATDPARTPRPGRRTEQLRYDEPEDRETFDRHYQEVHIPLAKKTPGLRRYTVSRIARPIRRGDACYLIAELDWDDMDALQRAFRSPEGQATADDVAKLAPEGKIRSMIYELEDV